MPDFGITLEEARSILDQAKNREKEFTEEITEMDNEMQTLSTNWTSEETQTFEEFKNLYNEKKKIIIKARDAIEQFIIVAQDKVDSFEDFGHEAKGRFE